MKVIKLKSGYEVPPLWLFMRDNLPPSLLAIKMDDGYGTCFGVKIKDNTLAAHIPIVEWFKDRIATVYNDAVELFHPQYYSDFEAIIMKYEAQYGREVKFSYWEAK